MQEADFHWLVGLLEGEGSFGKSPPSAPGGVRIAVQMTDRDVIERVAALWGVSFCGTSTAKKHHKKGWSTQIRGSRAGVLMEQLKPFMSKRRQAQIEAALDGYVPNPKSPGGCGTLSAYKRGCRCSPCKATKHDEYARRCRDQQLT